MAYPEGTLLDQRYCIEQLLARTNLNTIYLANDRVRREPVIVKTPLRGCCQFDQHLASCWDLVGESAMLHWLERAGIAAPRAIAFFHQQGRPHLVMSYVHGESLQSLYDRGALSPRQALHAVMEICTIVTAVHERGYLHHDIKPGNIVVQPSGQALLIDWGSAQPIGALRRRRMRTLTPEFTSLEQLQGRALAANDKYALGKTIEALVARPSSRLQAIIQRATASTNRGYPHVLALYYALARLCIIDDIAGYFGITMLQANPAVREGEGY